MSVSLLNLVLIKPRGSCLNMKFHDFGDGDELVVTKVSANIGH